MLKLVLLLTISSNLLRFSLEQEPIDYNPLNYSENDNYNLMSIPTGSKFQSNNTCVSYPELIKYNYTEYFSKWANWKNVYPENFCYSMLTYNISRQDFFNIVNKNLLAFQNYRRLMSVWIMANISADGSMNDGCPGYFRNVVCWSQFPACVDNGDSTWVKFLKKLVESICNLLSVLWRL
jgi:hypothetical protein